MEAFGEAEEFENELADGGVRPDATRPENGVMDFSPAGFPRIVLEAEEDESASAIIKKMKAANKMEP